jgi:hypothetical protein
MADIVADGQVKVAWMLTCSTPSAPTATEVNAGVDLEAYITPDGLSITTNTDAVDVSGLNSTQYAERVGRRKDDITITFKDQGRSAVPYTTFASTPDGYLVVRYGTASTVDWAASQVVNLYPVEAGYRQSVPIAANEVLKFSVPFFVTGTIQDSVALG